MELNSIRDVNTATFDAEVLQAAGPVLVDFWAAWCPPCRMIDPVVTELAINLRGRLTVCRVDMESDPEIGMRHGVLGMPTLILFSGGRAVDRMVGFSSPGHVRRWVAEKLQAAVGE
jgi:thioredoxin